MADLPHIGEGIDTENGLTVASGAWVRYLIIKIPSTEGVTQTLFSWNEWEQT
jgi:hypothetical protein